MTILTEVFVVFLSPSMQIPQSYLAQTMTTEVHILSNLLCSVIQHWAWQMSNDEMVEW
jgi:hypothetical protein